MAAKGALEAERERSRAQELRLHGQLADAVAMAGPSDAAGAARGPHQTAQETEILRAALAAEKARGREMVSHVTGERNAARTMVAQLKGEIEVQSLVIERTEEVSSSTLSSLSSSLSF